MKFKVGDHWIGEGCKPFVIAEMSGNHNQSLERAIEIVDAAADAGAHALKLQTYTADTMTLDLKDGPFYIDDPNSLWTGHSLHELYQKAYTPWEWQKQIYKHCKKRNIICFSTPFDATAVDFLEELENPIYKIASFENADIPLIRKVGKTKKPVIMSTGMATLAELEKAVRTLREEGCEDIVLLKCTSTYPASPKDTNIKTIPHLKKLFNTHVGLSDHTLGIGVALGSVALGATVVEKHFTLARADGGVDSAFSIEPHELKSLVEESERVFESLGDVSYGPTEKEKNSMIFRRSLFIAEDMQEGEQLNEKNLRCVRPGVGLQPQYYDVLLGKRVRKSLKKGTPVSWDIFE